VVSAGWFGLFGLKVSARRCCLWMNYEAVTSMIH
jgi:hypothetical protein